MRDIMKRLEELERKIRPQHLTILASLDGEQVEMTVQECIDKGAGFIKVLDGCNMKDLDLILDMIYQKAIAQQEEEGSSREDDK